MVFISRFSFKSLRITLNGQYLVSFSDSMDAYCLIHGCALVIKYEPLEGGSSKLREASGAISQEKSEVCEISQTPKRAAKLFRKTELSSPGCKVGFLLEVSSSLLAAWFVHRQKEKHLTVQKCCEILATKG
uniref:Uncharacterized protein n=1 Tax=Vitis vinifera TaxID=29760 RepID=A5AUX9_VITVI|nr:hypothetical protein VITISV_015839 [Vitis vinifera]